MITFIIIAILLSLCGKLALVVGAIGLIVKVIAAIF